MISLALKDFRSNCDQIGRKQQIWSHLLKKFLMENFIFCAVKHANLPLILFTVRSKIPLLTTIFLLFFKYKVTTYSIITALFYS